MRAALIAFGTLLVIYLVLVFVDWRLRKRLDRRYREIFEGWTPPDQRAYFDKHGNRIET